MNNQPPSAEPIYNIGAVTRLTGIPITSLRAWERRYGFPHPSGRTPGGHRLYSEKDVTLLRRQGWPVTYLGQDVPFAELASSLSNRFRRKSWCWWG
jgi:DNA-binding transcriptional MerR regulator